MTTTLHATRGMSAEPAAARPLLSRVRESEPVADTASASFDCPARGSFSTPGTSASGYAAGAGISLLQRKLAINEPGDRFELEADRMADVVAGGSGPMP